MRKAPPSILALPLPLQPLLLWQSAALVAVAGMVSVWYPAGFVGAALIGWIENRARCVSVFVVLGLAFLCGFAWGTWSELQMNVLRMAPMPVWVNPYAPTLLRGQVVEVRGLADNRIRILLDQVTSTTHSPPVDSSTTPSHFVSRLSSALPHLPLPTHSALTQDHAFGVDALPGKLAWTWELPAFMPVPGQWVSLPLKVRPVRHVHVEQGLDSALFWLRQGVSALAWSRGTNPLPQVEGMASPWGLRRDRLQQLVVNTLQSLYPAREQGPTRYGEPMESAPHGWGVLVALLFGDKRHVSTQDLELFVHAGLAHSLALSGQHLAVAGLGAYALFAALGLFSPGIFVYMPRFKLIAIGVLPLALGYVWLGAAPPSLMRAASMLTVWTFLCLSNRPYVLLDMLIVALLVLLLFDAMLIHDVGVRLSFTAVAGIALGAPLFVQRATHSVPHSSNSAAQHHIQGRSLVLAVLVCSIAVQLACIPLTMDLFGRIPPWGMVMNLLWLPVLGFWVLPLAFMGLTFLVPTLLGWSVAAITDALARLCLTLALEPCHWLFSGLRALEKTGLLNSLWGVRPHWTSIMGAACLFVALALLARRNASVVMYSPLYPYGVVRKLMVAGVCLLLTGTGLRMAEGVSPAIVLRLLDVGQGQSVLVNWQGQGRALIDGGGVHSYRFDTGRDIVVPMLTSNSPLRLDALILSHPHSDHARGLLFVNEHAQVGGVFVPAGLQMDIDSRPAKYMERLRSSSNQQGTSWYELTSDNEIPLGHGLLLEVLYPPQGAVLRGNQSLIVRLVREEARATGGERVGLAFVPGDAPAGVLKELMRSGRDIRAQVLVLPHHGSDANWLPELYQAVNPKQVWASAGVYNSYGFPGKQVLADLRARGVQVRVTAEEGTLMARW